MKFKPKAHPLPSVRHSLAIVMALLVLSCGEPLPPPQPPPPPPVLCPVWEPGPEGCVCPEGTEVAELLGVCAPPRVDRPIDWGAAAGATSFSLVLRDTEWQKDFLYYAHEHNITVYRAGAQVAGDWCGNDVGYLPCGPAHATPEADANLVRLLEVTARIPNTWLQLIPTFTYKSHDEGTQQANIAYFNSMFDHVNAIVEAGGYRHIIYELFNEVVHPLSQHIKDEDVREMLLHARARTDLPVGTDFHGEFRGEDPWPARYPFVWRDLVAYIAFHPRRNPEPTYEHMRTAQERWDYRKPVWCDETVCWASDDEIGRYDLRGKGTIALMGRGTEGERWDVVRRHLRDIRRNGWVPFLHTIDLIGALSPRPALIDMGEL